MARFTRLMLFVLLAWSATARVTHGAEQRIALVIGNSAYTDSPLANPANDARLMSAALATLGFVVIERLDGGQKEMKLAIKDYGNRLEAAGHDAVGLFFYAGHGLQVDGENYLIPIDALIEDPEDADINGVAASNLLKTIGRAGNGLNIIILDACRNNPFVRRFRSQQRGLALMSAPTGTLIAYSTAPGEVAADGDGANSPYTAALARGLGRPGMPIELMFKGVRDDVLRATQGRQTPWEASSLTGRDFYLAPAAAEIAPADPAITGADLDFAFWEAIEGTDDPSELEAYLTIHPNGMFAAIARHRIDELRGGVTEDVAVVAPDEGVSGRFDGGWKGDGDWRCTGFHQEQLRIFTVVLEVESDVARPKIEVANRRVGHAQLASPQPVPIAADRSWSISHGFSAWQVPANVIVRGSLASGQSTMFFQNSLVTCRGTIDMARTAN